MLKEFKEFALKGNFVDLAIGVVIGAAFGLIVGSLVEDVIMPVVGLVLGGASFSNMFAVLKPGKTAAEFATLAAAKADGAVTLNYGVFFNTIVHFLIVAFSLFVVVKVMNAARRQQAEAPAPPEPTATEKLLAEIRDALRKK